MHLSECYKLLGVPRNATLEDIKLAYRRLARKYHPDVNQNDNTATDKFRMVQEAYEMLKNADKEDLSKELFSKNNSANSTRSQSTSQSPKIKIEVNQSQPNSQSPKIKVEVNQVDSFKPKLDMLKRVQNLLKQRKYIEAISVAEEMSERFSDSPVVIHWQAVACHRWGSELILANNLGEAETYLNKALNADPNNRELSFEIKRDLERVQQLKIKQDSEKTQKTKVKIEVKQVNNRVDPINSDPELKLKLDMLRRVQDLLKEKKYIVAIAVVEGMSERFPNSPEVIHWKAVTYHLWGKELILLKRLREAEIYLNKALNTDPENRELSFDVKRALEKVQNLKKG